jgi:transposase InsO family protein
LREKVKLCKQGYYQWLTRKVPQWEKDEPRILEVIKQIHAENPALGYRLINDELRLRGFPNVNEKRTQRICHKYEIFSNTVKKKRQYKAPKERFDRDLIHRQFVSDAPNKVWLTDITEHHTKTGKIYWCGLKDTYSNLIVGASWGHRMTASLAVDCLVDALENRGNPKNVIIHSDGGGQFNSGLFRHILKVNHLRQSVGQAYTCADNASMESTNALIQKNVLNQKKSWESVEVLGKAIDKWVKFYNTRRRQRRRIEAKNDRGYVTIKVTPAEYDIMTVGHKIV